MSNLYEIESPTGNCIIEIDGDKNIIAKVINILKDSRFKIRKLYPNNIEYELWFDEIDTLRKIQKGNK